MSLRRIRLSASAREDKVVLGLASARDSAPTKALTLSRGPVYEWGREVPMSLDKDNLLVA